MASNVETALTEGTDAILALEREKEELNREIREKYAELKDAGFDTKVVRKVVQRLRRDPDDVAREDQAIADLEALIR